MQLSHPSSLYDQIQYHIRLVTNSMTYIKELASLDIIKRFAIQT